MLTADITKQRSLLTQKIRNFFINNNFLEVETPIMTPSPGMEPHLTPFETKLTLPFSKKTIPLYLNTSPELQMKKLLGTGFNNIFNITKVFRNGELNGPLHNPEFTMLEWYRKNADYKDLMKDCENLILNLAGKQTIKYQSSTINLAPPWPRLSTNQLFQKYCKIDLTKNRTLQTFKKTAQTHDYDTNHCHTWDDIYYKIFLNYIEPNLPKNRPIFIYDYPATQAALAKTCLPAGRHGLPDRQESDKNPFFAERFELYIAGIELANAFSELTDAEEQRARLIEEQHLRKKLNKTVFKIDEEFLQSLKNIKKPCAGIAMGLDRLFMILLDKININDVLLFPMEKMLIK